MKPGLEVKKEIFAQLEEVDEMQFSKPTNILNAKDAIEELSVVMIEVAEGTSTWFCN